MAQDYSFTITAVDNATSVIDKINSELDGLQNKAKNIDIGANGNAVKSQINVLSQSKQQTSKALKNLTTGAAKTSSQIISGATTAGKQVTSGITSGIKNAVKNTQSASAKAGSAIGKNIATASKSAATSNVSRTIRDWNKVAENATSKTPSVSVDKLFRDDAKNAEKEWTNSINNVKKAIAAETDPSKQAKLQQSLSSLETQRNANFSDKYTKQFSSIQKAAEKTISDVQEKGLSAYKALDPTNLRGTVDNLGKTLGNQKDWGGNIPEQISSQLREAQIMEENYAKTAKMLGGFSKTLDSTQSSFGRTFDNVQAKGLTDFKALDPTEIRKQIGEIRGVLTNQEDWGGNAPEQLANKLQSLKASVGDYSKTSKTIGDLSKSLDSSYSSFSKMADSVQFKGRSFRDGLDVEDMTKDFENLGYTLRNKRTWGAGEFQTFQDNLDSAQKKAKEFSKPENIMMDSTSIAKYAQKMSRALNGQMSNKTRKVGESYMDQIQNYLEGNSKVSVKDWRTQNIPGMESFMARASKENNGATGFFKRFSASLGAQNASFLAQYFSTQDMINYGKQMASMSTRVDSALTELRKVSDASPERLSQSKRTNAATAQKYGVTLSDAVNSTADWVRLGNSIGDSEKLAKISALFEAVGDNQNQQSVEQTLTSVQRAWKQTPKKLARSLDSINEICLLSTYCKGYEAIGC